MKKIILLLLCVTLITSCEKNEIEKDSERPDLILNDSIVIGPENIIREDMK